MFNRDKRKKIGAQYATHYVESRRSLFMSTRLVTCHFVQQVAYLRTLRCVRIIAAISM